MRIIDLLEKDQSEYVKRAQNDLVNYLTSLKGMGVTNNISTDQVSAFLRELGYDFTSEQIMSLLQNTVFDNDAAPDDELENPQKDSAAVTAQLARKERQANKNSDFGSSGGFGFNG